MTTQQEARQTLDAALAAQRAAARGLESATAAQQLLDGAVDRAVETLAAAEFTVAQAREAVAAGADVSLVVAATPAGTLQFRSGTSGLNSSSNFLNSGPPNFALNMQAKMVFWPSACRIAFQHMKDFGMGEISPSAGTYTFTDLDRRIQHMADIGLETGIVCALCPAHLKANPALTESFLINTVAARDEFADLCAALATRYDGGTKPVVDRYVIWNEMKGLFGYNGVGQRYDYDTYVDLYNRCYAKIKAVRPPAWVGGPYNNFRNYAPGAGSYLTTEPRLSNRVWGTADQRDLDVMLRWLRGKAGADFIAFDGMGWGRDGEVSPPTILDEITYERAWWPDLVGWIRTLDPTTYPGCDSLPIIAMETYSGPWGPNAADRTLAPAVSTATEEAQRGAKGTANMLIMAKAGLYAGLFWYPQGRTGSGDQGIWTDTATEPGLTYPLYDGCAAMVSHFPPGTVHFAVTNPDPYLEVLASASTVLVVNLEAVAKTVSVDGGAPFAVPAYGIRVVTR